MSTLDQFFSLFLIEQNLEVQIGQFAHTYIVSAQSHWPDRSRKRRHFYGTEYEIWADFGPVGNTEKKCTVKYANFKGVSF